MWWNTALVVFTRKMCGTCRVAASQAIRIVDRKVWQSHVALPWPVPVAFDAHDGDESAMKRPLWRPIRACSSAQRPCHTAFAVATANIVKWMELALQLE